MLRNFICVALTASLAAQGIPQPPKVSVSHNAGLQAEGKHALRGGGPDYDVTFTRDHVRFEPALGTAVDETQHLTLRPTSVGRTGESIAFDDNAAPRMSGRTAIYERSRGVREHFDVRTGGVELSWHFAERPLGSGDLVVRYDLDTTLPTATPDGDGCAFVLPEVGGIAVGGVTGIDARGHTVRGKLHCEGNQLALSLPADFVDSATYPIVLDPVIGARTDVEVSGWDDGEPDACYGGTANNFLVVWVRTFSATDRRVRGQFVNAGGPLVGGTIYFGTSGVASRPGIACCRERNRFGVVWQQQSGIVSSVQFAAVDASSGSIVNTTAVASSITDTMLHPDIGSDVTAPIGSDRGFVVVYEDNFADAIRARRVYWTASDVLTMATPNSLFTDGGGIFVSSYTQPAISRTAGPDGDLLVVARYFSGIGPTSAIRCMRINSATATPQTIQTVVSQLDVDVSKPDVGGFQGQWIVCWENVETAPVVGWPSAATRAVSIDSAGQLSVGGTGYAGGLASGYCTRPTVGYTPGRTWIGYRADVTTGDSLRVAAVDSGTGHFCDDTFIEPAATNESRIVTATQASGWRLTGEISLAVFGLNNNIYAQRLQNYGTSGWYQDLGGGCGNGGQQFFSHSPGIGSSMLSCTVTGIPQGAIASIFNLAIPSGWFGCGQCQWVPFEVTIATTSYVNGIAAAQFPIPCLPSLVGEQLVTQWTTLLPGDVPCNLFPDLALSNRSLMTIGN